MASFTDDVEQVRKEFKYLKLMFDGCASLPWNTSFNTLSMGMSGDFQLAIEGVVPWCESAAFYSAPANNGLSVFTANSSAF
jgi:hypothetical protein